MLMSQAIAGKHVNYHLMKTEWKQEHVKQHSRLTTAIGAVDSKIDRSRARRDSK